jgi:hypothetical protein
MSSVPVLAPPAVTGPPHDRVCGGGTMQSAERVDLIISIIDECLAEYERDTVVEQPDYVQSSASRND